MNDNSPLNEPMLRRKAAAKYLTERGLPIAPQTLAKYAVTGGGPVYRRFGRIPLYRAADLDSWALARLGPAQSSTSNIAEVSRD